MYVQSFPVAFVKVYDGGASSFLLLIEWTSTISGHHIISEPCLFMYTTSNGVFVTYPIVATGRSFSLVDVRHPTVRIRILSM